MAEDEEPPRPRRRIVRVRLYLVRLVERLFATLMRQA